MYLLKSEVYLLKWSLGGLLGGLLGSLGRSWDLLGFLGAVLGASWGCLGKLLGVSGELLGASWGFLERFFFVCWLSWRRYRIRCQFLSGLALFWEQFFIDF